MGGFSFCWLEIIRFFVSIPVMGFFRCSILILLLVVCRLWADAKTDFFSKIRPVLATHCFECHGHKDKGGLKLDSREAILKGGDSGPAIVWHIDERARLKLLWSSRVFDPIRSTMPASSSVFEFPLRLN